MTTALVTYERKAYVDKFGHKHPAKLIKRKVEKKKRRRRKSTKGKKRWYAPRVKSGWKKTMPAGKRRKLLLKAHKGNLLSAARSKQALANVTQDEQTRTLALADAKHFYAEYSKSKEGKK